MTVAPVARRTVLISSSVQRASANTRSRPMGAFRRVSGAWGRTRASSPASDAALLSWLAYVRGSIVRVTASRARLRGSASCAEASRVRPSSRAARPGLDGGVRGGGLMSSGSGVGSRITVLTSTAAMPSTSAWCILATSAVRFPARPSTSVICHSGRPRSRGSESSWPTSSHSSASPPGAGRATRRTWRSGSNVSSSIHAGLASPSGASSRRIAYRGIRCTRSRTRWTTASRGTCPSNTQMPPTCMRTGPRSAWMADRSEGESASAMARQAIPCGGGECARAAASVRLCTPSLA